MNDAIRFLGKQINYCPQCGKKLDGATAVGNKKAVPKEGDISICVECGLLLKFGKTLELTELTEADVWEIEKENPQIVLDVARMRAAFKLLQEERLRVS